MVLNRRRFLLAAGAAPWTMRVIASQPAAAIASAGDPEPWDVVVCGAGPAGYNAAIAAARAGAKTLLLEEDANPGGAAVDCGVSSFAEGPPIEGIHREVCRELMKFDPYYDIEKNNSAFLDHSLILAVRGLLERAGVQLRTGTRVIGTQMENGRVAGVRVETRSRDRLGETVLRGRVFIDATGNADLALSAGVPFRFGREARSEFNERFAPERSDSLVQRVTWMFIAEKFKETGKEASWCKLGEGKELVWGATAACPDPTDPVQLEQAQAACWAELQHKFDELRLNGYRVIHVAPRPGIRESRRIVGEYTLNYNDLIQGRIFDDRICRAQRIIDSWEPEGNPLHLDPAACAVPLYTIPYRSLRSRRVANLLVAGRAISGTHVAHSSYRVQPIAAMTGQAAGTAAALASQANGSVHDVELAQLQNRLRAGGLEI